MEQTLIPGFGRWASWQIHTIRRMEEATILHWRWNYGIRVCWFKYIHKINKIYKYITFSSAEKGTTIKLKIFICCYMFSTYRILFPDNPGKLPSPGNLSSVERVIRDAISDLTLDYVLSPHPPSLPARCAYDAHNCLTVTIYYTQLRLVLYIYINCWLPIKR